jgi:hypothetical protein
MSKKLLPYTILSVGLIFLAPLTARAVCPACTLVVGAGIGLTRWLGVDDTISGVWIGGLIVSMILWMINWLNKKNIRFPFRKIASWVFTYLIILLPLYWKGVIGHPSNTITIFNYYIDKILFGVFCGSVVFLFSAWLYNFLKKRNGGKPYFPFQKIVMPVLFLAILSVVFYIISKYK